jgi:hypothetical protein
LLLRVLLLSILLLLPSSSSFLSSFYSPYFTFSPFIFHIPSPLLFLPIHQSLSIIPSVMFGLAVNYEIFNLSDPG